MALAALIAAAAAVARAEPVPAACSLCADPQPTATTVVPPPTTRPTTPPTTRPKPPPTTAPSASTTAVSQPPTTVRRAPPRTGSTLPRSTTVPPPTTLVPVLPPVQPATTLPQLATDTKPGEGKMPAWPVEAFIVGLLGVLGTVTVQLIKNRR